MFADQSQLAVKSREALDRMNSRKKSMTENVKRIKPNYSKLILEEYDEATFKDKVSLDGRYYNVLFRKLEESKSEEINTILGSLLNTVRQIYEHINIKPKVYGVSRIKNLNESEEIIEQNINRVLSDFFKHNYYELNMEERANKYLPSVKSIASDFILKENVDVNDAVQFSIKTTLIEKLLENISFPEVIKSEIESNLTSEEYASVFDSNKLNDLYETFSNQIHSIAKIAAAII